MMKACAWVVEPKSEPKTSLAREMLIRLVLWTHIANMVVAFAGGRFEVELRRKVGWGIESAKAPIDNFHVIPTPLDCLSKGLWVCEE